VRSEVTTLWCSCHDVQARCSFCGWRDTCRRRNSGSRTRNFDSKFLQKFREISRNFDRPAPGIERLVCGPAAGRNGSGNGS